MAASPNSDKPKRRRRDRGDDGIWWDKANKCYVGAISLGTKSGGKRNRPSVRGRTKAEVKNKLDNLHDDINAGIRTPATYTIEQCAKDWFNSIERDPHTMETITGQAKNWIYRRSARRSSSTSPRPTPRSSSMNSPSRSASVRW